MEQKSDLKKKVFRKGYIYLAVSLLSSILGGLLIMLKITDYNLSPRNFLIAIMVSISIEFSFDLFLNIRFWGRVFSTFIKNLFGGNNSYPSIVTNEVFDNCWLNKIFFVIITLNRMILFSLLLSKYWFLTVLGLVLTVPIFIMSGMFGYRYENKSRYGLFFYFLTVLSGPAIFFGLMIFLYKSFSLVFLKPFIEYFVNIIHLTYLLISIVSITGVNAMLQGEIAKFLANNNESEENKLQWQLNVILVKKFNALFFRIFRLLSFLAKKKNQE